MNRPLHRVVKFFAVVGAAIAIFGMLASLSGTGRSPYMSALSDWAAGPRVEAAAGCGNRVCASLSRCVHQNGSHTNCGVGDFCRESPCP